MPVSRRARGSRTRAPTADRRHIRGLQRRHRGHRDSSARSARECRRASRAGLARLRGRRRTATRRHGGGRLPPAERDRARRTPRGTPRVWTFAVLRLSPLSAFEPLERLWQQILREARETWLECRPVVLVGHRRRALGEDRPGIEGLVHQVKRHSELWIALANSPRDREWPAPPRQRAGVGVEDAEPGNRQHLRLEQPRVPEADSEVGVVRPQQSRQPRLLGYEAHIEVSGRTRHEVAPALPGLLGQPLAEPWGEKRHGLVAGGARERIEAECGGQNRREDDNPPGRVGDHVMSTGARIRASPLRTTLAPTPRSSRCRPSAEVRPGPLHHAARAPLGSARRRPRRRPVA